MSDLVYPRTCDCPHGFPICAHGLPPDGELILFESRRLSAIAGWPGPITDDGLAVAQDEWSRYELPPPEVPAVEPLRMAPPSMPRGDCAGCSGKARALQVAAPPRGDCGCGKRSGSAIRSRIARRAARQAQ